MIFLTKTFMVQFFRPLTIKLKKEKKKKDKQRSELLRERSKLKYIFGSKNLEFSCLLFKIFILANYV